MVRLGVSPIHGIGVFAQCDIAGGTSVFASDQRALTWVAEAKLDQLALRPFERAFYDDFAIRRAGLLGCPANFNLLSVGWYLNQPRDGDAPNMMPDTDDNLVAARAIAAGEELTLRYADFRDPV